MAASEQERLFAYFLRNPPLAATGFEPWLRAAAGAVLGKAGALADSYTQANKARLWTAFSRADAELHSRGRAKPIHVLNEPSRVFRARTIFDAKDPPERAVLQDRPDALQWLDGIDDRDYEFFGAVFVREIGATKVSVSRGSGDRGIDFHALLPLWGPTTITHYPRKVLRVLGQSKMYTSRVQYDKAAYLAETVDLVRKKNPEVYDQVPDWFRVASGPVVGLLVASAGISSGATTVCHDRGVFVADSLDALEEIIRSRRFRLERSSGTSVSKLLDDRLEYEKNQ